MKEPDLNNPKTNQMEAKFKLRRNLPNVQGAVLWYAKAVADNMGNYGSALRTYYWKTPALQPLMPFIDHKRPKKPKHLKAVWTSDGLVLFWEEPKGKRWGDFAQKYVVYRFAQGEDIDIDNPAKIVAITHDKWIKLPYDKGQVKYRYVVTALDRMSNESRKAKKKVWL